MSIDGENSKISNFLKAPVKRGVGKSWRSCILLRGTFQALQINKIKLMDDSSYAYGLIFYLDKKDEICHCSSKEHPKISNTCKIWLRIVVKNEISKC
jgi:hypothetical protein